MKESRLEIVDRQSCQKCINSLEDRGWEAKAISAVGYSSVEEVAILFQREKAGKQE